MFKPKKHIQIHSDKLLSKEKVLRNLDHNKATKYTNLSRDPDNNLCPELFRHKHVTVLWWFLSETSNCPPFSTSQTLTYRPPVRRKHTKQFDIYTHLHISGEVFTEWYSISFVTQSFLYHSPSPSPLWLSPGTRHVASLVFFTPFSRHSWMIQHTHYKKQKSRYHWVTGLLMQWQENTRKPYH